MRIKAQGRGAMHTQYKNVLGRGNIQVSSAGYVCMFADVYLSSKKMRKVDCKVFIKVSSYVKKIN